MKKLASLIVSVFGLYVLSFAQTNVSPGIISGTWTLAGSPYKILGSVQIPNDSTLVIQPGVTVDFQGPFKFAVKGRLIAIGTITDSIKFTTSLPPDLTPPSPNPHVDSSHWEGIVFDNITATNDSSKMIFCIVQSVRSAINLYSKGGVCFSSASKAIISRSTITNCSGGYYSAGIYCEYSSPEISYNLITNNPTTGIYCYACNPKIMYNIISNDSNTTIGLSAGGGGIFLSYSNPFIFNNIITNNSAYYGGGICCNDYSIPVIYNNVIANNHATYGGGFCFHNTNTNINPSLYNNIIWGNTASSGGGSQVYLGDEENDPNFFYNDVQGGTSAFALNGTIYTGTFQNNINTNPLFVSPSGGSGPKFNGVIANWSLQSNSPCIDSGFFNGNYPPTDMAGNPRVNVCRIDIGAHEYQTGIPLVLSVDVSQPIICNGAATGIASTFVSGGTSPYTYLWSNGQTTPNATGLVAGNYTVTVHTPSYGCSLTKSITLTQPPAIAVDAGTNQNIVCDATVQLNAQPGWVKLNIDSGSNTQFTSVYFTSEDTGFVVGSNGTLLKTTNGGAEWTAAQNVSYNNSHSVFFINSKTGFVVGDYGVIIKTMDGGSTWIILQQSGSSYNLNSVYFTDANTGYAVGTSGKIIKTVDGGINWTSQSSGTTVHLNSVYFTDANHGCAVGNNGVIVKTNNGGTNWSVQTISSIAFINEVYFTSANTGYAVGNGNGTNGNVLKTNDGGINWTVQSTQSISMAAMLRGIYFTDSNTGYIVGGNGNGISTIMKTTNAGVSWSLLSSAVTTNDLYSIFFRGTNVGYAVGNNGTILKLSVNGAYKWSPSSGLNNDNIQAPTANVISDSKYFVTFTSAKGCIAIDSINIHVNSLMIDAGIDKTLFCGGAAQIDSIGSNYTGKLFYHWSPKAGLSNDTVPNPAIRISGNRTYTLTVNTLNGCTASDSVRVMTVPMNAHDICIVTVDANNKNIVVWNKPLSSSMSWFNINRETNVTNVYQKIGAVNYNSFSTFVDTNSFPDVQSNKYKISIRDTCGLESVQSTHHKTMHLTINQGTGNTWNLIWEAYEGFTVSTYNVYRGTSPANLQFIGTSSGSNTQYSDMSAPSGYVYYQVEVLTTNTCNPSKTYNSSRSNISTNNPTGVAEKSNHSELFSIYPNPSSKIITINILRNSFTGSTLNIYNAIGALIKNEILFKDEQEIDVSDLSNGIYFVEIRSKELFDIQKLIIDR